MESPKKRMTWWDVSAVAADGAADTVSGGNSGVGNHCVCRNSCPSNAKGTSQKE